MMLEQLRDEVVEANLELVRRNLVIYTFGNASGISRERGIVAIKPSGVPFEKLTPPDIVLVDLEGNVVEGTLRPSSDVATHLVLYRAFASIGGVVHTHSSFATAWAQAERDIPCFGTTHADYFYGNLPVTRRMHTEEIEEKYEENTGHAIVRRMTGIDPSGMPAVLVTGHGPFCWGPTAKQAAETAVLLEEVAKIAYYTAALEPLAWPIPAALLKKHFRRKHGPSATYGQKKED